MFLVSEQIEGYVPQSGMEEKLALDLVEVGLLNLKQSTGILRDVSEVVALRHTLVELNEGYWASICV